MFFFHKMGLAMTCGSVMLVMFVILSLSNFKIRLSMVLVLGTFDEESLGTKIHRNGAAASRWESITGDLAQ